MEMVAHRTHMLHTRTHGTSPYRLRTCDDLVPPLRCHGGADAHMSVPQQWSPRRPVAALAAAVLAAAVPAEAVQPMLQCVSGVVLIGAVIGPKSRVEQRCDAKVETKPGQPPA